MTDQWIPGPGCTPAPPDGIPPANTWTPADSCAPPSGPSITGGVIITGVPATIGSMVNGQYAWTITLNDGQSPPNFSIDRYSAGALVDHPIFISGVDGSVAFTGPVTLSEDPTAPMQAATKEYVDTHSAGVTEAPTDGQLYGRQSEGWTVVPPSPIAADAPNDGQAYVRQSLGWAPLSASLNGYMPISGGAFTGPVTFPANNSVLIAGTAGTPRAILGVTGNAARWQMLLGDTTAESGANAGSNFALNAIGDTGALLSTPLSINRQYGNITIPGLSGVPPLAINGINGSWRAIQSQTNGSPRWQMYLADPSGEIGSNAGSNFVLNRYSDAGAILGSALSINRASGAATFSALPSFPGGAAGNVLSTNGAGALSWITPSGGGIADAPNDGTAYARKSAGWANLTHADITDWTATLAPYALTTSVPIASTTTPSMNGTAAVGTGTTWARADHVHPTDTSLYPASNPSGYQTAAQVTASLGAYLPIAGGTVTGGLAVNGMASFPGGAQILGASPTLTMNKNASGQINNIIGQTAGANRWSMQMGSATGETGGSVGSQWALFGWTDAGVATNVMSAARNTNVVTFTNAIVNGSDARLKENVEPIADALAKVKALLGVSFNRIGKPERREIGFLAQDVQDVVPEVVEQTEIPLADAGGSTNDLGLMLGMNYAQLTALLVEAVKTLAARVEALEAAR